MNSIDIYTVDAFTDRIFQGNTCAVCVFSKWPDDVLLQNIAKQNLFAETAFIVPRQSGSPELRWFTVSQEVDFCGYGTLSAGFVFLNFIQPNLQNVTFLTRKYGLLPVQKIGNLYQISVPVKKPLVEIFDESVYIALGGVRPSMMMTSERRDLLVAYESEHDLKSIKPDFQKLMRHDYYGYVLTSPSQSYDYAFRYFSPRMTNVWEDPVNGASQSVLAAYWAGRLNKNELHGRAVSDRGGDVFVEYKKGDNLVKIGGHVTLYAEGKMVLPDLLPK